MTVLRTLAHPLVAPTTWRRWAYLVLGGAVLAPFVFVAAYPLAFVADAGDVGVLVALVLAFLAVLVAVAAMSMLPVVRRMEVAAAKELLRGPIEGEVLPDRVHGRDRVRSGAYFCLHLLAGSIVGTLTLTLVPLGISWILMPFTGWDPQGTQPAFDGRPVLAVLGGLLCLVVFVYLCAGLGVLLSRWAPSMLGRSPTQRLHEVEQLADDLSERNRIARDLHDSVGHALSIVTVQTGAARRLLDTDPEFARDALAAVEESASQALSELDRALGTLRDGTDRTRTLAQVETLVRQSEAAGVQVRSTVTGPVDAVSPAVSHEAYAIIQESLANALRHAPGAPVDLVVTAADGSVEVVVSNPLPYAGASTTRPSGGRGVPGMRERARALGGDVEAVPVGDRWRVTARLPLGVAT